MPETDRVDDAFIVTVGTQVVTLVDLAVDGGEQLKAAGTVGTIMMNPDKGAAKSGRYSVQFLDGQVAQLERDQFVIRKHLQKLPIARPDSALVEKRLYDSIVYRCTIGSRAYGLEVEHSDIDTRGIFLPPADLHWSLYGVPEQLENDQRQECFWEIEKFIHLSLKGNTHVLECLYAPDVELAAPAIDELLASRAIFLSKLVYLSYNGYVLSQFKKLEKQMQTKSKPQWKPVMHPLRILLQGITILQEGYVPVRVDQHRERLMAIRLGEMTWDQVKDWRGQLHKQFDQAYEKTSLPERPDYQAANMILIGARKQMVAS